MLFLVRLAFWLGLAFSAMEWPSGALSPDNAGDLAAQATRLCAAQPRACMEAARVATRIVASAEPSPPARAVPRKKIDTLAPGDRVAAWKGKT